MAVLDSGTSYGSSPPFIRKVECTETARTATSATFKVTLYLKINKTTTASYYGYDISWSVNGGTSTQIKSSSGRWYGGEDYRSFSKTVTVSGLSAAKGTTTITIKTTSTGSSPVFTKGYSMSYSSFNTAPKWGSGAAITLKETSSGGTAISSTHKVAENISAIYIQWPTAEDAESNISKYQLECSVDGGTYATVYSGANKNYTHSIGSGSSTQGKAYQYRVKAIDSYSLSSSYITSVKFYKNKLTAGTISASGTIPYAAGSSESVTLTIGKGSQTKGGNPTYKLSSSQLTIYNATTFTAGSTAKLGIWNDSSTAAKPSGPYVYLSALKSLFSGSSYKGTFTLTLTTSNTYGSSATKSCSISVDLRTNPVAPTSLSVSAGKTTVNGGSYIIPSRGNITLSWSGAKCNLGTTLKYDVQYVLGTGTTYTTLASNITATSYAFKLNAVTASTAITFRVVAKTTFNYSSNKTLADTLHYYNAPTITFSSATRAATTFSIKVETKTNTSITSVAFSSRSYTGKSTTATSITASPHTISDTGLTESSKYTISVTVQDNSGLSEGKVTKTYNVVAMNPMFSIRELGVGVNCVNAYSESAKLKVNGGTYLAGATTITGTAKMNSTATIAGATTISGATTINNTATARKINVTPTAIATASTALIEIDTSHDGNNSGNFKTLLGWNSGGKYYHYFRGSGKTTFDTLEGVQIVGGDLDMRGNKITNTLQYNIVNSSSGKSGRVYAGTGGIAMTADSGTNLHLGVASATDFNIDADKIWVNKPLLLKAGQGIYTTGDMAEATQLYSNIWRVVPGSANYSNMYVQTSTSGELRIQANTSTSSTPVYRPIRTSTVYIEGSSVGYLGNNLNLPGNSVVFNGTNSVVSAEKGYLVLRSVENNIIYNQGSQLRVVAPSTTTTYRPALASAFTVNSTGTAKTKIQSIDNDNRIDTMQLLKDTNVYTYHLTDEIDNGFYYNKKIGFIAEATPRELKMEGEKGIDLYSMTSTLWDVCKKQQETIESQQEQIEELWEMVNILCDNQEAEELIAS